MGNITEEKKERFLSNLRLVNERAGVKAEVIDLLEAFARMELDRDRPVCLPPPRPQHLDKNVREFVSKNHHLPPQALDFLAAYCQHLHEQNVIFLLNSAHLAKTLSLTPNELNQLAATAEKQYFSYQILKNDGSFRDIHAPKTNLKVVQRAILDQLLTLVPLNNKAHGFRRGRSIVTNSQRHVGQRIIAKVDIKDFFPSITAARVFGLFMGLGYPREVSRLLTRLTTYEGSLPTGAPTSPVLSNLVCRRLDRRLAGVGEKMQFEYSRYADDMTFSSRNVKMLQLLPFLQQIINEEGFSVKTSKTRIQRNGAQQKVTGIVVNSKPNIARKEIRTLRAILNNCKKGNLRMQARKYAESRGVGSLSLNSFQASLRGKINHVRQVNPEIGQRLLRDFLEINFPA